MGRFVSYLGGSQIVRRHPIGFGKSSKGARVGALAIWDDAHDEASESTQIVRAAVAKRVSPKVKKY